MNKYPLADTKLTTLTNAPVVYAAVMIMFPEENSLDDKIAGISSLIKKSFIQRKDRINSHISVSLKSDGHAVAEKKSIEYVFSNAKNTLGFTLSKNKIFFHVSDYPRFSEFSEEIRGIMSTISKELDIKYFTALGIRYIDRITPINDSSNFARTIKCDYESARLVGGDFEFTFARNHTQALTPLESQITLNIHEHTRKGICIPQDLLETVSLLSFSESIEQEAPFVILDTDHVYTPKPQEEFDLDDIMLRLKAMHSYTTLAFEKVIHEDAIEHWR